MAIITISRGCFSHGKDIAEKVAETLSYNCVSKEVIIEASEFFQVSEKKLFHSLHDAPGLMEKFTHGQDEYLAYISAALMENVKEDNVVYHGYGGHLLLPDVSHVMKVRIISDLKTRVAYTMEKEHISYTRAEEMIRKEDAQRRAWTSTVFGKDMMDPGLYDIVLNIGNIGMDEAVQTICELAGSKSFTRTETSQKIIDEFAIKKYAEAVLYKICQGQIEVHKDQVDVFIPPSRIKKTSHISPGLLQSIWESEKDTLNRRISKRIKRIPGVKKVTCHFKAPQIH
ncbi:MAG: cytidylate kinase-like family protein [Desulfobacteraceae bacterium]|nr:MAG: cytidylate kinase-like family protein [Desulfobacteraceae bacterium]